MPEFSSIVIQLMICTGVSVAFIIGTFITWRALALTGKTKTIYVFSSQRKNETLNDTAMDDSP